MSLCDEVQVRFRREDGVFEDVALARLEVGDLLAGWPVRAFRVYRGRRHYSGWYASSTMGRHVVYESRLELARLMLADQDARVVRIAAQPMQLRGRDGRKVRRHVPDFLLEHDDSSLTLVDVKAPTRMADPRTVAQFAWTRTVCDAMGWRYETWAGADPVLLQNIRFLAGYRRRQVVEERLIAPVVDAVGGGATISGVEWSVAGAPSALVRPVVLHLLWASVLHADLSVLLGRGTVVRPGPRLHLAQRGPGPDNDGAAAADAAIRLTPGGV